MHNGHIGISMMNQYYNAMLTEKDYCDYDTCVALEELGLSSVNNECFQSKIVSKEIPLKFFDTTLQSTSLEYAPIISLYEAQKWLREEKKIEVNASFDKDSDGWIGFIQRLDYPDLMGTDFLTPVFNSYEEALLEGIKEVIEILKDNRRQALESENTEYDYGHNVYHEEL